MVGRHQPHPVRRGPGGPPRRPPLVGDAEEQLMASVTGTPSATGASSLVVGQAADRAGTVEDQRGVGAATAHQARRQLERREVCPRRRAEQRERGGGRAGPEKKCATAASTASPAIRRYVVSLPPTIVITLVELVSTACRREVRRPALRLRLALGRRVGDVEQRPQAGERPHDVAGCSCRENAADTTSRRKPISGPDGTARRAPRPSTGLVGEPDVDGAVGLRQHHHEAAGLPWGPGRRPTSSGRAATPGAAPGGCRGWGAA